MIDPRGLSVHEWCDLTAGALSSYGSVPVLQHDQDWRLWGEIVVSIPAIAQLAPPDPRFFDNWGDWAARFIETVPY